MDTWDRIREKQADTAEVIQGDVPDPRRLYVVVRETSRHRTANRTVIYQRPESGYYRREDAERAAKYYRREFRRRVWVEEED